MRQGGELAVNATTQIRNDLGQVSDDLSRMKDRSYRSPDEAYADLIAAQTRPRVSAGQGRRGVVLNRESCHACRAAIAEER
jgi:NAD-dependent dihydropyrimidine dehydrogenase PreA subunit